MEEILKQKLGKRSSATGGWTKFFISIALVLIALYIILNYIPFFANQKSLVIVTDSMKPLINVGDVAIINKDYDISALEVDDIIAFNIDINNDGQTEIVVHYIASIENDGFDNYTISTKRAGVAEQINWDSWEIDQDDIVGIYNFKIAAIGKILLFLSSPFGKIIAIVNILVIFLVIDFFKKEKEQKKRAQEKHAKVSVKIKSIKKVNNTKVKSKKYKIHN